MLLGLKTHPPPPHHLIIMSTDLLISKHAPAIGSNLARLAFSRSRDLRTRGVRRCHNSEPSREPRRPGAGRPGPPLLRSAATRRQRGMALRGASPLDMIEGFKRTRPVRE